MSTYYRLDVYDENEVLLTDFSTDPAHARPYLREPENLVGQDIDLAAGRAKIGSVNIEVVDVPGTPGDNDSGVVTAILPTIAKGTRAQLLKSVDGGPYTNVLRGVFDSTALHDSYSSFTAVLKDEREVERRTRAFTRVTTASVVPRGVIAGFGFNSQSGAWFIPPTKPLRGTVGTFTDVSITHHRITLPALPRDRQNHLIVTDADVDRIITDKQRAQFAMDGGASIALTIAPRVRLLWRLVGGGGYTAIEEFGGLLLRSILGMTTGVYKGQEVSVLTHLDFDWTGAPANGTTVEFIVGYAGEASEDYPFHYEGTVGGLLADIYNGVYSEDPGPAVRYNAAAVAALTQPVRARVTKPTDSDDGVWKWVEENIYAPFSLAPALGSDGELYPVSAALPAAEVLLQLDDNNCEPAPAWGTSTQSAINTVVVKYPRLARVPAQDDAPMARSSGDGLFIVKNVRAEEWHPDSKVQVGDHPLELECETLCALGGADGRPISGEVDDEAGNQVALRKAHEAIDRQAYGAQTFGPIRVLESAWGSRRVGAFVIGACSWWPDFNTARRGANRLLQVVSVNPQGDGWVEITCIDCGNEAAPVAAPTVGAATVTDDSVSFLVTPASGTEARAEYAVNATLPAADSPLWRFLARVDAATTVRTPPLPLGSVVHRRARGELVNRRPSAWVNGAGSSTITAAPRITLARVQLSDAGAPTVTWERNALTLGVRLRYSVHAIGASPSYGSTIDRNAADGSYTIATTVAAGQEITVELVPYTGWNGTNVTGTAGTAVTASASSPDNPVIEDLAGWVQLDLQSIDNVSATVRATPIDIAGPYEYSWRTYSADQTPGAFSAFLGMSSFVDITNVPRNKRVEQWIEVMIRGPSGVQTPAAGMPIDPLFPHLETATGHVTKFKRGAVNDEDPQRMFAKALPADPDHMDSVPEGVNHGKVGRSYLDAGRPNRLRRANSDVTAETIGGGIGVDTADICVNGGGQIGDLGVQPPGWTYGAGTGLRISDSVSKFGDRSLVYDTGGALLDSFSYQDHLVIAGQFVEISGWIKTTALTGVGLGAVLHIEPQSGIFVCMERTNFISFPADNFSVGLPQDGVARDFTFVRSLIRCDDGGVLRVYVQLGYNGGVVGVAYFDGIKIKPRTASERRAWAGASESASPTIPTLRSSVIESGGKGVNRLFAKALPADTDDMNSIADGVTYKKVAGTALTNNEVDLSKAGVINRFAAHILRQSGGGTMFNITERLTDGGHARSDLQESGGKEVRRLHAKALPADPDTMDSVVDGTSYKKVNGAYLDNNRPNVAHDSAESLDVSANQLRREAMMWSLLL